MDKLKKRDVILSASLGFILGYLLRDQLKRPRKMTPERALEYAKETFQKHGPITGSWIYVKPEKIEKNNLIYYTYRGGISRNYDGNIRQYEFYSDITTGTIVHVEQVNLTE